MPHVFINGPFKLLVPTQELPNVAEKRKRRSSSSSSNAALSADDQVWVPSVDFLSELTEEVERIVGVVLFGEIAKRLRSIASSAIGNAAVVPPASTDANMTCVENNIVLIEGSSDSPEQGGGGGEPWAPAGFTIFDVRFKDTRLAFHLGKAMRWREGDKALLALLDRCQLCQRCRLVYASKKSKPSFVPSLMMNMDDDLFHLAHEAAKALPFFSQVQADTTESVTAAPISDVATLLTRQHAFITEHLNHAAVMNEDGNGSPFLAFLFVLFQLRTTKEELLALAKHTNFYLRALAMYYARYMLPIEELGPYFIPSFREETLIRCYGDSLRTLKELCMLLLESDDVDEAFLPTYGKFYQLNVVRPMMREMEAHNSAPVIRAAGNANKAKAAEKSTTDAVASQEGENAAKGITTTTSLADLLKFVEMRDRFELAVEVTSSWLDGDGIDEEAAYAAQHRIAASSADVGAERPDETDHASKKQPAGKPLSRKAERNKRHRDEEHERRRIREKQETMMVEHVQKRAQTQAQRLMEELLGSAVVKGSRKDHNDPLYLAF